MDQITRNLLKQRAAFELVTETPSAQQVRLVGRVDKNRQSFWTMAVHHLMKVARASGNEWTCDISRQYILDGDDLRYAWRIIIQTKNVQKFLSELPGILESTPRPSRVELDSYVLPGYKAGQSREGINSKGKGAQSAMSPVVGPLAQARLQRGGQ